MRDRRQVALRALLRTRRPVLLAAAPAVGFLEAAIRGCVRDRLLVVIGGRDGERLAAVAEACGKEVIRAHVPEGSVLEPHHLTRFLDGPAVDAVALMHVESSTGAVAPLEEMARVIQGQADVLSLVDASHSLGAEPLEPDCWGIDLVVSGSAGSLGIPDGLAVATTSERLIVRARGLSERGWHLDLVRLADEARSAAADVPLSPYLMLGLDHSLDEIAASGGITARWRAYAALRDAVASTLAERPQWEPVARAGRRASAVVVLREAGADGARLQIHFAADADVAEFTALLDRAEPMTNIDSEV